MTLTERATLSQDNDFRSKVQAAAIKAAGDLLADSSQEFIVQKYAALVAREPGGGWLNAMVFQVLANPAITQTSSDDDIQYTVNSNFNKLARANYAAI